MVMQTTGVNYYTPGWNNGTYIPPAPNPMGGYTTPQYVPQPTIPQPTQTFGVPNQIRPVNGRVVSSENDITPNDVPMDNTVSLFPTDDYSCIFAKQWTSDGKIKTTKFVPVDDGDDYYGKSFNRFRKAKRHYTQTHSEEDKQRMKDASNKHMMETMATIREIWDDADPELRKRMKTDMTNLMASMN